MARRMRGDTLIEVLLAIVVLGAVIVGSITIMSRGLLAAQTAMEHSQVRQYINGQFEMLRKLRDDYARDSSSTNAQVWRDVVTGIPETVTLSYSNDCTLNQPDNDFYLTPGTSSINRSTYTGNAPDTVAMPGQGLWIEAKKSPVGLSQAYVDFVVRACWYGSGSEAQQRTVTAVRLYDPSR